MADERGEQSVPLEERERLTVKEAEQVEELLHQEMMEALAAVPEFNQALRRKFFLPRRHIQDQLTWVEYTRGSSKYEIHLSLGLGLVVRRIGPTIPGLKPYPDQFPRSDFLRYLEHGMPEEEEETQFGYVGREQMYTYKKNNYTMDQDRYCRFLGREYRRIYLTSDTQSTIQGVRGFIERIRSG